MTRKDAVKTIKLLIACAEYISVCVEREKRLYATLDCHNEVWGIIRISDSGRRQYFGQSYKTLSGALNKLDKFAETEVR